MGLFDALGSALGVAGSSLVSPVFSAASGILGNAMSADRQSAANEFSANQFATRYQTTVKDMQAAGLNPMLAYSQGPGSAPSSAIASANMPDVGASLTQSKIATAQIANIEADTANKAAQADLIAGQAAQAWSSATLNDRQLNMIDATVDKIREEIKNIPDEGKRIRQAAQMLSQQSTLMAQQGASEQERQAVLRATAAKLKVEKAITDEDYKAILSTGGVGRIAREVKPISDIGSDWLSPSKWFTNKSKSSSESVVIHK